jgi:hypothetical protein
MEQLEYEGRTRLERMAEQETLGQITEEQSPHGNFYSSSMPLTLGPRPPL